MEAWAFATSPHGLGLSAEAFWCLDADEHAALRKVYDGAMFRWALERAEFRNAHFETAGVPWTADDFTGKSDRDKRKLTKARDMVEVNRANTKLMTITAGKAPTADVPAWAIGEYHAN